MSEPELSMTVTGTADILQAVTRELYAAAERGELPAKVIHEHDYERGAHMAHAFGVDGRRYACAICGEYRAADR